MRDDEIRDPRTAQQRQHDIDMDRAAGVPEPLAGKKIFTFDDFPKVERYDIHGHPAVRMDDPE